MFQVELGLVEGMLLCSVSNQLSSGAGSALARRLETLLRSDPKELLVHTVETTAIEELLDKVLAQAAPKSTITLDVRSLSFVNSSGINVLYKFAIALRKKGDLTLVVKGSKGIPWQGKSLPNIKKFNPDFEMILSD